MLFLFREEVKMLPQPITIWSLLMFPWFTGWVKTFTSPVSNTCFDHRHVMLQMLPR